MADCLTRDRHLLDHYNGDAIAAELLGAGISYREVDLSTDPEARDYVLSLGYLGTPVIDAGPAGHWSGSGLSGCAA